MTELQELVMHFWRQRMFNTRDIADILSTPEAEIHRALVAAREAERANAAP